MKLVVSIFFLLSLIYSCRFYDDSIAKPHFDGLSIFRILNYERYMPLEVDASAFSRQNNERSLSLSLNLALTVVPLFVLKSEGVK